MTNTEAKSKGLELIFPAGHPLADRIYWDIAERTYYDAHTDLYVSGETIAQWADWDKAGSSQFSVGL